jgi:hypothetical protein
MSSEEPNQKAHPILLSAIADISTGELYELAREPGVFYGDEPDPDGVS